MNFLKCQILNSIDRPVHVVLDSLVELDEVLFRDDVVSVQIQDVIEEIFELILLEICQQILKVENFILYFPSIKYSGLPSH